MSAQLPLAPEDVTPAWLTAELRKSGRLPADASVISVTPSVVGEGVGFVGLVARLTVTYDRAVPGAPATMIGKFPAPDPGSRAIANLYGLYEREARFYQDLSRTAGIDAPECYFAAYDPDAGQSLVLLEDLRDGAFGDQVGGCSLEEARTALRAAADFHATWWESPRLNELSWMTTGDALVRGAMVQAYDACWEPCRERFGYLLTPKLIEQGPELGKRIIAQLDRFADRPLTLAHGDYRLDNMFFSAGADSSRPVIACDWQSPSRSWAAYDLAYFLAGALEPKDRAAHEWDLAREYHQRLQERGVSGYTWEMLEADYLACLGVMMGIFVVNGATLPTVNDRAIQVFEKMIGRFVAAVEDLNVLDVLPQV